MANPSESHRSSESTSPKQVFPSLIKSIEVEAIIGGCLQRLHFGAGTDPARVRSMVLRADPSAKLLDVFPSDIFLREYVSYSRLQTYKQCPRKFKLRYLFGCRFLGGREAQLGKLVHEVIAEYLRDIRIRPGSYTTEVADLMSYLSGCQERLVEGKEIERAFDPNEVEPLLLGFGQMFPRIDASHIGAVEQEIDFHVGNYPCKAVLDLVLLEANKPPRIIDFKTGKPRYVNKMQIDFYALAYSKQRDCDEILGEFAFLREGRRSCRSLDELDLAHASEAILDMIHEIEEDEDFPANPSPLCKWCEVREYGCMI